AAPASPTAAPPTDAPAPATAEPATLLPTDAIWIRSGTAILAQDEEERSIDLQAPTFPTFRYGAVSAPDGSRVAYMNDQDRMVVVDLRNGATATPGGEQVPMSFRFSPDGRELAVTLNDSERWQLQVIDLESGAARTLQEGALLAEPGAQPSFPLMPLAWTPAGIMVQPIMWATDAPPQGLVLVNPADGAIETIREEWHLDSAVSPDGTHVAVVVGEMSLGGDPPPTMEIRVFDVASRQETTIVASQPGFVRQLRWSPDGATLLYSMSSNYGASTAMLVAIGRDGSGAQQIEFDVQGQGMMLADIGWRDSQTALVLLGDPGAQLELHALPLSAFNTQGMQQIGVAAGRIDTDHRILYVPD
ncbi:MAG TPA: hypothetical protein VFX76_16560, partial [Roseiflexaceae bacterium]|nr:hypothetical protein [Roseiflexaceae bacterium]